MSETESTTSSQSSSNDISKYICPFCAQHLAKNRLLYHVMYKHEREFITYNCSAQNTFSFSNLYKLRPGNKTPSNKLVLNFKDDYSLYCCFKCQAAWATAKNCYRHKNCEVAHKIAVAELWEQYKPSDVQETAPEPSLDMTQAENEFYRLMKLNWSKSKEIALLKEKLKFLEDSNRFSEEEWEKLDTLRVEDPKLQKPNNWPFKNSPQEIIERVEKKEEQKELWKSRL